MFRLVQELRTRGVARAEDLALRLEVSTRTVYRDIAHLQGSGLPIEGAAGIGYLLRPGFDLPNVTFTHDQVEALALGLAFAERAGDPVLAAAARDVRAKLQAGMPDPGARRLADAPFFSLHRLPPPSLRTLRSLREAIRRRRVLRLVYRNGEARPSDRRIRPLALWCFAEGWMVSAWCELRQDFRTFRLDRIAALAQTGEAFADDPATSLSAFLAREDCEGPGHDPKAGPWQEAGRPAEPNYEESLNVEREDVDLA